MASHNNLTNEQQHAAHARTDIAVVAGAGTGKTHMLAERYLYHLQVEKMSPLEVVALTYTERAANELRARVRQTVEARMPEQDEAIAELEAAQISTLHALCARICRDHPEAAGVAPDFEVLDEIGGAMRSALWFDEALDQLPARLFESIPFTLLANALKQLLADPHLSAQALAQDPEQWPSLAADARRHEIHTLTHDARWLASLNALRTWSGKDGDLLETARREALAAVACVEGSGTGRSELKEMSRAFEVLCGLKSQAGSKGKWANGGLDEVRAAVKQIKELSKSKREFATIELSEVDETCARMLPALRVAFSSVKKFIDDAQRAAGLLDFAGLELCALRALEDEDVARHYAKRWRAFLVDEFQDTNPVQAELLERLTSGARLTIVGDEKQAIYGFRRADVRVFRQFRERIKKGGGAESELSLSFRTHAALVETTNAIASELLSEMHQPLTAHRTQAPHVAPHLEVFVVNDDERVKKFTRQQAEARHIARTIRRMIDEDVKVYDKEKKVSRAVEPSDFAILSRAWAPLETYAEALARVGVPAIHAGGGNLLDTREAKDAFCLLRFLADITDDIALIAILRSPFFAISDASLFQAARASDKRVSWWQRLCESHDDELSSARSVMEKLLDAARLAAPGRLLQLADRLTGYSAVISNMPNAARRLADWRAFHDFVVSLETQASQNVRRVLTRLKRLMAAEVEIPRTPLETHRGVALMTMHGAKGLEWAVTVLPDLTRAGNNQTPTLYACAERGVALIIKDAKDKTQKPLLYKILEREARTRTLDEEKRLLYVALTRARDHLLLTATEAKGNKLDLLRPGLAAAKIELQPIEFRPDNFAPAPHVMATAHKDLKFILQSAGSGIHELPISALTEYATCPMRFRLRYVDGHPGVSQEAAHRMRVGRLVHLALELDVKDEEHLSRFDVNLASSLVSEALELAENFRLDEAYQSFRTSNAKSERAVSLQIESLRLHGIADVIGEDFVLDFKSDAEINPQVHRFQMWAYARAARVERAHIAYLRHARVHTFNAVELASIEAEALSLIERLQSGDFKALPTQGSCAFCAYAEICEERYGAHDAHDAHDV
jgi:ATP-dependent helicase/nuclease subunit A